MATTNPELSNLKATCHCGKVEIEIPALPETLNECHCSICYKYGALWGYFTLDDITVTTAVGATLEGYVRSDTSGDIQFNRCSECGCMVSWTVVAGKAPDQAKQVGVNCRMLPEVNIHGVERRISPGPE